MHNFFVRPAVVLTVVAACLASPALAANPSFLCSKSNTWIEKTVCSNDRLSELDMELAVVYARLLRVGDPAHTRGLESDQHRWWSLRAQCQHDASPTACVQQAYESRITALKTRPEYPGDGPAIAPKIIQEASIKEGAWGWAKNLSEYFKAINQCVSSRSKPTSAVLSAWKVERGDTVAMWLVGEESQHLMCIATKDGKKLIKLRDQEVDEDLPQGAPILYLGVDEPKHACAKTIRVLDASGNAFGWLAQTGC